MKKFLMAATMATTTMAATAHAGSISYDFRGDYQSVDYNSAAENFAGTKNADFNRFYFKVGRIDFKGNLNEDTSYRFRIAFYGPGPSATNTRENVWSNVQFGYLTQKLGAGFSVSLGKMASDIGGFEGGTSGADLYLLSESYSHSFGSDKLASRTYGTGDAAVLYMTGVKASYAFMDQTIDIMALNPVQDETNGASNSAGAFNQNQSVYGIVYKGAYLDKALGVIASYHQLPGTNNPPGAPNNYTSDDKTKTWAAGIKWESSPILATLEYIGQQAEYTAATGSKDKMDSFVLKAAYTGWDQWTPRIEVTNSTEKVDSTSSTNKFQGYGAIVEYKPRKEDIFRYHIAYNYIKETPDTGSDLTRQELVVGARLLGDFLK